MLDYFVIIYFISNRIIRTNIFVSAGLESKPLPIILIKIPFVQKLPLQN